MTELSLHILDIVHNSIAAKATLISISIGESLTNNILEIEIADNGIGMDDAIVAKVLDPFFTTRTTRDVGLGLPLFKLAVELCNGSFIIKSALRKGTTIKAILPLDHIDRQPLGDMSGVIAQLVSSFQDIDFVYRHKTDNADYIFDSREVKDALDGMPMNGARIINFIREMIRENLHEIKSNN